MRVKRKMMMNLTKKMKIMRANSCLAWSQTRKTCKPKSTMETCMMRWLQEIDEGFNSPTP